MAFPDNFKAQILSQFMRVYPEWLVGYCLLGRDERRLLLIGASRYPLSFIPNGGPAMFLIGPLAPPVGLLKVV